MSNYSQTTFFGPKDALTLGDPNKFIKGTQVDVELGAISTAIASKFDSGLFAQSITWTGNHTFTPGTGVALAITNVSGSDAIDVTINQAAGVGWVFNATGGSTVDVRGVMITNSTAGTTAGTYGLVIANDSSRTMTFGKTSSSWSGSKFVGSPTGELCWVQSGGAVPISFVVGVTATEALGIASTGAVRVNAPTSGASLTVTGLSGGGGAITVNAGASTPGITINASGSGINWAQVINGASTSGNSLGLLINAGTTSADTGLNVLNQAGTTTYFKVRGDGQISAGGPIAGTLIDMTPDKGSWTTTLSGPYASNPTGTLKWVRIGALVMVYSDAAIAGASGGGSSAAITVSGLPAAITPAAVRKVQCGASLSGNSLVNMVGGVTVNTNNTMTINTIVFTSTTADTDFGVFSNTPSTTGINAGFCVVYPA